MDWKREAKAELRDLPVMREAAKNIPDRIAMIEAKKTSLRAAADGAPDVADRPRRPQRKAG